ncbi:unnamed protein product [Thlaspi arvense]|uniref:Uncharacterized protein n=1 Tax=Thlaspi arvense TaxID=13288 RepID=A0AAU9RKX2_THLAR|nr:unnamed protein product [Thlaspi arvense]
MDSVAEMVKLRRILLVTFPGQGQINPSLQFAKRLVRMGVEVTFATAFSAVNRMSKSTTYPQGLKVVGFSDGHDDGLKDEMDYEAYMADLRRRGSEAVAHLVTSEAQKSLPFDHPAAMLDIYYYYCNGYGDALKKISGSDSLCAVEMPGLPPLRGPDLPSFVQATNWYKFALPLFKEHLEILESENNPKVLLNTFEALEPDALRDVEKLNLVGIGPLIPSAFLDGRDPSDTSFEGDLFQVSSDYIQWLNSKPQGSVIYVALEATRCYQSNKWRKLPLGC